jgi:uncharacterized delta-60 repeat protein
MSPSFRSVRRSCLVAVVAALLAPAAAGAAPGDLDTTFSGDGRVTTDTGDGFMYVNDVAVQPDGKVVVAGAFTPTGQFPDGSDFMLIRYTAGGAPDPSFGGDGIVTTDFTGFYDGAVDVAVTPAGKIVAVGWASTASTTSFTDHALVRYNADGSLDDSFAGDGRQTLDFNGNSEGASAVALLPDGRILIGGSAQFASGDFALARFAADGSLDSTFSGDGKQTTDFNGTSDGINALAIAGGRIVAAGRTDAGAATNDFALAVYDAGGTLDDGFSTDGKVTTDFETASGDDVPFGVAIQPDGKIIASGHAGADTFGSDFGVARYDADGSPDASFSGDGRQTVDFDGTELPPDVYGYSSFGTELALEPDGTILVAGSSTLYNDIFERESEFAVAALAPDGSLDGSFSGDGKTTTSFGGTEADAETIALAGDGSVVVAGTAVLEGKLHTAVARYEGDPRPIVPDPDPLPGGGDGTTPPPPPPPAPDTRCVDARSALTAATTRVRGARSRLTRASRRLESARKQVKRAAKRLARTDRDSAKARRRAKRLLRIANRGHAKAKVQRRTAGRQLTRARSKHTTAKQTVAQIC